MNDDGMSLGYGRALELNRACGVSLCTEDVFDQKQMES